jgi:FKBP-type peptidyl-prolyl cis-trans isomerase FklB
MVSALCESAPRVYAARLTAGVPSMNAVPIFRALVVAASLVGATTAGAADAPANAPAVPHGPQAEGSYAIGLSLGSRLREDGVATDNNMVLQGIQDGLTGARPRLNEEQLRAAIAGVQSAVTARRQEVAVKAAVSNKAQAATFLKANAAKPGVTTLPSGLQYEVLTRGTGPRPKADDTVDCNYRGTLLDGKEFDSSYAQGKPVSFAVNGVIKGWTEALQLMPVGSKWRIFVPSDLAYGDEGAGTDIGPGAALVFEIELLSIEPKG